MNRNVTPYSQLKVFYHQDVIQNLLQGSRCNPVLSLQIAVIITVITVIIGMHILIWMNIIH